MRNTLFIILIILILGLSTHKTGHSASMYDPGLTWKSLKTDHFRIHYHQGLEGIALRIAAIAEKIHKKLSREIRWEPVLRTDVILIDNTDLANGFATPYPFNKIQLYIVKPELNSVLNHYDSWLEMALTHEYTHILDMDMASCLPAATRVVPGRCCFPNAMLPIWTLEGSAVYHESKDSAFGRNNSSYTDMVLRTEVLNNTLKPIDQASHFPREWPRGNVPYLYGGMFIGYLEQTYGAGSIEKFFHRNSDNIVPFSDNIYPIPYFFNKDVKDVYKKSFPVLWREWEKSIKERYNRQIEDIRLKTVTQSRTISPPEDDSILPRFARDGKSIYFISNSPRTDDMLIKYELPAGKMEKLSRVNYPNSLSLSPSGEAYISDIEFYNTFSTFYDIHVYDKKYRRITTGLRGSHVDIFPDGKRALVLKNRLGNSTLEITDLQFKTIKILIKDSPLQIGNPRISPDGSGIVFVVRDSNGRSDLVLLNIGNMEYTRLTNDPQNDIDPAWHPDGKRIVFSSDRDGVYNLYEYRLDDRTMYRITNLLGGAFSPDVSGDGKTLAFASYGGKGRMIALMDYPPVNQKGEAMASSKLEPGFFAAEEKQEYTTPQAILKPDTYSPIYSIMPAVRVPYVLTEEMYPGKNDITPGFIVMGMDTFMNHSYSIDAAAHVRQKRASVTASYTYSGLYPDIHTGYKDEMLFYGKDTFPWEDKNRHELERELRRFGFLSLYFPFIHFNYQQYSQLSYIYEKARIDLFVPGSGVSAYEATFPRVQWIYIFNNARTYTYSIGLENGRTVLLLADYYHSKIGSDNRTIKGRMEYSEFLPGFDLNHIFMARARGGYSRDNQDYLSRYNLGKFKNNSSDDPMEKAEWGIRGYPAGSKYGDNSAIMTIEYRAPLIQRDSGIKTVPLMFRDIWLNMFAEWGDVWDKNPGLKNSTSRKEFFRDFKSSAGIEMNMKITAGYNYDFILFTGYARGFKDPGEKQWYWGFSSILDSMLQNRRNRINHL